MFFQVDIGKQFVGRAITLIVWPILLYMCFFYIHLEVLNHSGSGDGFFSTAFQSQLIGNSLHNATMPRQVAYGAIVTLKNHKTGGGYLHSHYHLYPKGVGIRQQQVNYKSNKGILLGNECDISRTLKKMRDFFLYHQSHQTADRYSITYFPIISFPIYCGL